MLESSWSVPSAAGGWAERLALLRFDASVPDAGLLSIIETLEQVKNACAAAQARATHEYTERRLSALAVGSDADRKARHDIASRIARARRVSPPQGRRNLELSRMLVRDLPRTLDALAAGQTNEHRAGLIAHAAACLGTADRATLDTDLGPRLSGKGNRAVQAEADRIAAELDAAAVVERHRRAVKDRRVTLRPAPDTMTYLTALLPVADGVATWAALDRHATLAKAQGDRRSRGQLMADELTRRLLHGTSRTRFFEQPDSDPALPSSELSGGRPTDCRITAPPGPWPASPAPTPEEAAACDGDVAASPAAPSHEADIDVRAGTGGCRVGRPTLGDDTRRDTAAGTTTTSGQLRPIVNEDPAGAPHDRPSLVASDVQVDTKPPMGAALSPVRQIDLMLVMTDRALLDGADTPAVISGYGPVPAALARGMLADADPDTRVFLRRLYTDPTREQLLTADARGRLFPHAVRQFVLARDQRCRTPFCDAPIRHIDHTVPHSAGGSTSLDNSGGLCERCSLTKNARTDAAVRPGPPPPAPRSAPWDVNLDAAV